MIKYTVLFRASICIEHIYLGGKALLEFGNQKKPNLPKNPRQNSPFYGFRNLAEIFGKLAEDFVAFQGKFAVLHKFSPPFKVSGRLAGWKAALQRSDPPFWAFQRVLPTRPCPLSTRREGKAHL